MIFEPLHDSNQKGEFYGSMCHWHLRRDGQITIREIIIEQDYQGNGQGKIFLERLKKVPGATSIFAKCPIDLPANDWYKSQGFELEGTETTSSGRQLKLWRLKL
jgi:N-acetylglutamate synthase-like GNAT family acetyltransferase